MPRKTLLIIAALAAFAVCRAGAAEFDIDSGRVVLRQLQYCLDCGSALLVTGVRTGVAVRCPDCGHEQPRLEEKHLLTQLYQLCKTCSGPMNPEGRQPGEIVACPNCHTRQELSPNAIARGGANSTGLGYAPGFPPGSGKKTLLFSPNRAGGSVAVVPLPEGSGELPLPDSLALRRIPAPPPAAAAGLPSPAEAPRPPAEALLPPGRAEALLPPGRAEPYEAAENAAMAGRAVDVPAVTAKLFDAPPTPTAAGAAGRVLARVEGRPIYAGEVERVTAPMIERLRQQAGPAESEALAKREAELRREVLERLVDRELVLREAEALGYKPDRAEVHRREAELAPILSGAGVDLRLEAERDVTMADMRRRYAERPGSATPTEIREFYKKHRGEMLRPRFVAIDQLVVYEARPEGRDARGLDEIAVEVALLLERGARFDELRERYDEFLPCAGLPYTEPELLPETAYARQVMAAGGDLRTGAVFGPVFMPGLALFGKVTEERPAGPVPFAEVEKDIRRRLEEEATERNLDAWIKRLRQKAKIEIFVKPAAPSPTPR